jgi:hypothetical protein
LRDPFSPFAIELDTMEFEFAAELWHWRGPSLFPKDGGYVVPIKDAVRLGEGLAIGHTVTLELSIRS